MRSVASDLAPDHSQFTPSDLHGARIHRSRRCVVEQELSASQFLVVNEFLVNTICEVKLHAVKVTMVSVELTM